MDKTIKQLKEEMAAVEQSAVDAVNEKQAEIEHVREKQTVSVGSLLCLAKKFDNDERTNSIRDLTFLHRKIAQLVDEILERVAD